MALKAGEEETYGVWSKMVQKDRTGRLRGGRAAEKEVRGGTLRQKFQRAMRSTYILGEDCRVR